MASWKPLIIEIADAARHWVEPCGARSARSFVVYDDLDPHAIECPAFGAFAALVDGDCDRAKASDYIRVLCDEEKYDPV